MFEIKVKNLEALYHNGKGVRNISFEIHSGEFIALLGHNGSGKTTLLNTLVGIKDFEGIVDIDLKYHSIAYVSQKQVIDWYLNVEDNIRMEEVVCGKKDINLFDRVVRVLQIEKFLCNHIEELSGGQLQRVQIARALLKRPDLYILDEPTTGLDVSSSENVMEYLKNEVEIGKTVIVSSHDLNLIEKYCERIIFLSEGQLMYDGSMKEFTQNTNLRERILKEIGHE